MSSRQRSPAASKAAQPDAPSVQRKPRVLLTGFDPFGGERLNPSWLAVQSLHGKQIAGHTVVAAQLPTVFGESLRVLRGLIERHQPSLVICLGQAGGRGAISLERVAINIDDAAMPDNAGAVPVDEPVVAEGPTAYFSRLPIKAMLAALREAGLPADVSQTAGTFVCNHVFYGLMHDLATRPELKETRGGFIHVPWLPEQGKPHLPLADVVHGLRVAVRSAVMHLEDLVLRAGAVH